MLFLRSFDIYIENTIISSYILYILLNSFNYFPLREINIFPDNNYFFTLSLNRSILACYSEQRLSLTVDIDGSIKRMPRVACLVSRVTCRMLHVRSTLHRASLLTPLPSRK